MKILSGVILRLIMILLLCWRGVAWAGYEDGEEAYLREDFPAALSEWRPLAEEGNTEAQNMLGYMYRYGQGVPQDFEQA